MSTGTGAHCRLPQPNSASSRRAATASRRLGAAVQRLQRRRQRGSSWRPAARCNMRDRRVARASHAVVRHARLVRHHHRAIYICRRFTASSPHSTAQCHGAGQTSPSCCVLMSASQVTPFSFVDSDRTEWYYSICRSLFKPCASNGSIERES
jgi:hypothetical protein